MSCDLCKACIKIILDPETHEPRSFISTKLAGELLSAIEMAEVGPMPKVAQSEAATAPTAKAAKRVAPTVTEARIAALEASIQAGEEDLRRQLKDLHLELRDGLERVQRE